MSGCPALSLSLDETVQSLKWWRSHGIDLLAPPTGPAVIDLVHVLRRYWPGQARLGSLWLLQSKAVALESPHRHSTLNNYHVLQSQIIGMPFTCTTKTLKFATFLNGIIYGP